MPVGYYTHVMGLGENPSDVRFVGEKGVYSPEGCWDFEIGALDTFWRIAENFQTEANHTTTDGSGMIWAVSQASPLRRVNVENDLMLFQFLNGTQAPGYASGGFMSDMKVRGKVFSGSQQQWMTRNSDIDHWEGGNWNMVFVGVAGAPLSHCGQTFDENGALVAPFVTVPYSPRSSEKPYIYIDPLSGKYFIKVPAVMMLSVGPDRDTPEADDSTTDPDPSHHLHKSRGTQLQVACSIPFEKVYVASPEDSAAALNKYLFLGLSLIFSPGIYQIDEPLVVSHDNQVIIGLGLATLISANGNTVIQVGDVDGARVASVLLQAGPKNAECLLRWGNPSVGADNDNNIKVSEDGSVHLSSIGGNGNNPGFMHDVFMRVGGPEDYEVMVDAMLIVENGNVIGDNLWLWRADHTVNGSVTNGTNPCQNGAIINGDNVVMYGLAVEHTLQDQVIWNGENGQTYFFQCELPYDVTQENFGDMGFVGFRVNEQVQTHESHGAGVYHYFRDDAVVIETAIKVPKHLERSFTGALTSFLNGQGTCKHILNNAGNATSPLSPNSNPGAHVVWLCD